MSQGIKALRLIDAHFEGGSGREQNHYKQQTLGPFLGSAGLKWPHPHTLSPLGCYSHLSMCDLNGLAISFFLPVHSPPDHK